MSIHRDLELLYELGSMRFIARTWRQFLGADFANETEHTFRVVWLALILARNEQKLSACQIDEAKIMKMALVHDLSESRSVDTHYLSRQYVERHEHEALHDTLAETALADFLQIYEEYEQRTCIEAKLVKDADNLDVDLELREQSERGITLEKHWQAMRQQVANTKLYTQAAKDFWQEIKKSKPHDWHLNGRNRFNGGDWKSQK